MASIETCLKWIYEMLMEHSLWHHFHGEGGPRKNTGSVWWLDDDALMVHRIHLSMTDKFYSTPRKESLDRLYHSCLDKTAWVKAHYPVKDQAKWDDHLETLRKYKETEWES